ncbi:7-cyano-7-deazaguanine tRNA-ribosyltransferase [Halalkaliarchaeum desulfuricum]|uniref:tRNA-guanine(15) transglycosylase n=1 Tax=Halalkaliarchaeum desulfuricum TaxID=2055893 RepID=A0A343TFP6_9EURY|nr:tRNA guanosine(15) transglycosylase TgtA [Halalkaliarchaeum desulfuricum]AUX07918.1 7-cyano-7-deazaguanine tRNA-ribosyltransferase [Halalkaliarchaeum desulfuricum]
MRDCFELRDADCLGRIGELSVPRADAVVETPALMPVINPNLETIAPSRLRGEFGAEILITNSYIIHSNDDLREQAQSVGLHEMLGFDGVIATDSGSFQLAEYGDIDVTTEEILAFQREIGSDVATPVDIPTPPAASREQAERDLETTETALADAEAADTGEMLVNAPIQGSTYPDLRERTAERAAETDLDVFPVGAVVPLMNSYRYDEMIEAVLAAKRGLGPAAPVHLFGAGHPMTFALAVAAGCDLFDSAAYAIYARDGRYLTASGTEHLSELSYLPCSCPVCVEHTPDELRDAPEAETERLLAEHNLHDSFAELRRIKEAIRKGRLLELVERRARGHPALLDGYRALLDGAKQLEREDPTSKGTFFAVSPESARRPEVLRHHDRLDRLDVPDSVLITEGGVPRTHEYDAVWRINPPFGPYPRELAETYPLTAETPDRADERAQRAAADGVARLADVAPDSRIQLAHDDWVDSALDCVPGGVELENLAEIERRDDEE